MSGKTKPKIAAKADQISARMRHIASLIHDRNFAEAEAEALKLLKLHPDRPDVHNILGVVYVHRKKRNLAIRHFEFATKADSRNAVYLNNLGRLYLDLKAIELALPFLHNAISIDPKLTATLISIGDYYLSVGKSALGLPYLKNALKNEPGNASAKWKLAESLDTLGRKSEANAIFQELRQDNLKIVEGLYHISRNNTPKLNVPLMAEAKRLLSEERVSDSDRSSIHTSIGFMLEKEGKYQEAFDHFVEANRLRPAVFDIEQFRDWVSSMIERLTADVFRERAGLGSQSSVPIFVVGMPRSGTTLTEQVIASHGSAAGAGELLRIPLFAEAQSYTSDIHKFIQNMDALGPRETREIADNYVNLLRFHAPDALRVVDKLPHNFLFLGFIALLWPKARIIHCSRNPADTCLSCYQNRFSDRHAYNRDLSQLGLYYREYWRLMQHWKTVLPVEIYDLSYERFTENFEGEARKLIEFVGLPWDSACLSFHEANSTVRTLSRQQVRRPIYKSSVGRWRHYEAGLQPLMSALGDLA